MSSRHHSHRNLSIAEHYEEQLIGRTTQMNAAQQRRQELLARISNGQQPGTSNAINAGTGIFGNVDADRDDEETSSDEEGGGGESAAGAGALDEDLAPLEDETVFDASELFPQVCCFFFI